jgi:hypothetical protein
MAFQGKYPIPSKIILNNKSIIEQVSNFCYLGCNVIYKYDEDLNDDDDHHHHSEHDQGLGLKTCSFEAQGVPGPSILLSVFPYPAIPEVGTGKPASVGGFYLFVPVGLPISFDTVLCPPLCCPLSNCYGSQGFFGGPIL